MTEKELITILCVNFNTSDFLKVQMECFKQLTKNRYKYLIADNGSDDANLLALAKFLPQYQNAWIYFRQQSVPGSIGHAEAVDFLISKVDTPYFLVMDADAIILEKNWDEKYLSHIDEKVKAVGAPPVKNNTKPIDFPFSYIVFLETYTYKKLGCSFMPVPGQETKGKDTGHLIRQKFFENNFQAICLDDHNTRTIKTGPYSDILCAEYYWKDKQESHQIAACHFARGASDGITKYKNHWYYKIPLFSRALKRFLGKRDRKKWIERTYAILSTKN